MRGEQLMDTGRAAAWLTEQGRPTSRRAVWDWITRGVQGVRLEAASIGGKWVTSEGALRRFISASTKRHAAEYGAAVEELRV